MTERYEAILFDFDGVLVDSEPVHYECWRDVAARYGIHLEWETYDRQFIGVSDRNLLEVLGALATPPVPVDTLLAEYPNKKQAFIEKMLVSLPFSLGVADLLPELSAYRVGLVTSSGRAEVEPILEAAGLRHHFEVAVFGEDVRRHKPDPEPYQQAARRLGVTRALVIEDSAAGAASGKAAGFDVLHIPSPGEMTRRVRERLSL